MLTDINYSAIIRTRHPGKLFKDNPASFIHNNGLWRRGNLSLVIEYLFRGVAQLGRAPGLGPGGRRFESCRSDHFIILQDVCCAGIAQR